MLLVLESSRLCPYNRCEKLETSIVAACTPSPIITPQALSEWVRFYLVGSWLPIAELLLMQSSISTILTKECVMCPRSIHHASLRDWYLFRMWWWHRFLVFSVCFKPHMAFWLCMSDSFQWVPIYSSKKFIVSCFPNVPYDPRIWIFIQLKIFNIIFSPK